MISHSHLDMTVKTASGLRVACRIANSVLIIAVGDLNKDRSQMRLGEPMKLPGRTHLQGVLEPYSGP